MIQKIIKTLKSLFLKNVDLITDHIRLLQFNKHYKHQLEQKNIHYPTLIETMKKEYAPIFVLSTGRCGTKLLTEMFKKYPQTTMNHSTPSEMICVASFPYQYPDKKEMLSHMFEAARLDLLVENFVQGKTYIETNNRITFFAPIIAALIPHAKFIHIVRDPIAITREGMARRWYNRKVFSLHELGRIKKQSIQEWESMSDLEKNAWLWNETNQYVEEFKQEFPNRTLTVQFHDLVSKVDCIESIIDFIGLPPLPKKYIEKKLSIKVNRQKENIFKDFSDWTEEEKKEVIAQIPLAKTYGYPITSSQK